MAVAPVDAAIDLFQIRPRILTMQPLVRITVGSVLYGLTTKTSDIDTKGVSLPSAEDLLGWSDTARSHWEEPADTVIYSITKFFALLEKGNPTVIEIIGHIPKDCYQLESAQWESVRHFARQNFFTKRIIPSFFGYVKDQYERVAARKAQNNRTTMIAEHGFDIKCASHVYRLAVMATELMLTGDCHPRMTGKDLEVALDIKTGKYNYEKTLDTLQIAIKGMRAAESGCTLPERADIERVNAYVMKLHMEIVRA